jgi:hypothetical protein
MRVDAWIKMFVVSNRGVDPNIEVPPGGAGIASAEPSR